MRSRIYLRLLKLFIALDRHSKFSFSHCGEDLILENLAEKIKSEYIFVDIGAGHPRIHSDSFLFSKKGILCINVEANPFLVKKYRTTRSGDLNLNFAVAITSEKFTNFEITSDWHFSRINNDKNLTSLKVRTLQPIEIIEMIPSNHEFILKIDIEGLDYEILQNFLNLGKLPCIICIEAYRSYESQVSNLIEVLCKTKGYRLVAHTPLNDIYMLNQLWK
jgi:FkbM family methyltransferase